ncbi:MAG: hypothetical protein VW963_10735, partial [Candidatus Neomarinimicrobiota bacterium]
ACTPNDTVLIHPGTYNESIDFGGKNIVVGSLFLTSGDSSYIENTIVDAGYQAPVAKFENGETNEAQLVGLTLQKGWCGILVGSNGPTLRALYVKDNMTVYDGSGFQAGCNPSLNFIIDGCTFVNNNYSNYVINVCNINNDDPNTFY